MSGAPAVPFAALALYVAEPWQKTLFGVLALSCIIVGSYVVWKRERENVIALTSRIAPRFEFVLDENCPCCVWDEVGVRWLRVGIRNISLSTVNDVVVSLEDVEPNPNRKLQLPIALRPKDDRSEHGQPITLHPGGEGHAHIDFFAQA